MAAHLTSLVFPSLHSFPNLYCVTALLRFLFILSNFSPSSSSVASHYIPLLPILLFFSSSLPYPLIFYTRTFPHQLIPNSLSLMGITFHLLISFPLPQTLFLHPFKTTALHALPFTPSDTLSQTLSVAHLTSSIT